MIATNLSAIAGILSGLLLASLGIVACRRALSDCAALREYHECGRCGAVTYGADFCRQCEMAETNRRRG